MICTACKNVIDPQEVQSSREREFKASKLNELLLHNAPLLIELVDCDDQFSVFDCNKKLLEAFGLTSKEEFVARFDELHPEFQPCGTLSLEVRTAYNKKAMQDGYVQFEYLHLTANGEHLPVETTIVRLDMKDKPILVCFNHDLRSIKNEMKKTQKSEKKSRLMFRVMPIACILVNDSYEMLDCNKAVLDMTYNPLVNASQTQITECIWQAHCILGADCNNCKYRGFSLCFSRQYFMKNYLRSLWPLSKTEALEIIDLHFKKADEIRMKGGVYKFEYDFTSLNGDIVPCEVTILPVDMMEGKIYACYFVDLRYERLRQSAESENLSKTRFLAYMSHEIRTPLNSVLGIAEIQLQNETLSPEIQEDFLRIHNSARILLSIIDDILDLSKAAAGKMEINNQQYELLSVIGSSLQLSLIHYDNTNVAFVLNVDESLPVSLIGDEMRIIQIIVNILTNAFKYTEKGTVTLNIGFEQAAGGDFILAIEVQDTGKGMNKEQLEIVCKEFVRFKTQDQRCIAGIGLGLPITSKLIQLMNGELVIESEEGKGSVFKALIPQKVHNSQAMGKSAVESIKMLCSNNRPIKQIDKIMREPMPYGRVLIVDDLESNLHVAKQMILPYKINVQTADSGKKAISKIKSGEVYDIIFMDHMMPGMDGIEAAKIIRDLGYTFPIIALTANAVKGMEELFLKNGFTAFLSKPINLQLMDGMLQRYIRDKQPEEVINAAREAVDENKQNYTKQLTEYFVRDIQDIISHMESLIENNDWNARSLKLYTLKAHAIKGVLASMGRVAFSQEANSLEQAGKAKDINTINKLTPAFTASLKKLLAALMQKEPDTDQKITDETSIKLRELLSVIYEACQTYNIETANSAANDMGNLPCPKEVKALVKEIQRHLLHGAFEEAAEIAGLAAKKVLK